MRAPAVCFACPAVVPPVSCWCFEHLEMCGYPTDGSECEHPAHLCEAEVHYCEEHKWKADG